jgi:hypothetical protein
VSSDHSEANAVNIKHFPYWSGGPIEESKETDVFGLASKIQFIGDLSEAGASYGHDVPPEQCKLLSFELKDIPGVADIKLVMDLSGRVTANHEDPIRVLRAAIRWCQARGHQSRSLTLAGEVLMRLLVSQLIVQKEF